MSLSQSLENLTPDQSEAAQEPVEAFPQDPADWFDEEFAEDSADDTAEESAEDQAEDQAE